MLDMLPISVGMLLESLLPYKCNLFSFVRLPISEGMLPLNPLFITEDFQLFCRYKVTNAVRLPISLGIEPLRLLPSRYRYDKFRQIPYLRGNGAGQAAVPYAESTSASSDCLSPWDMAAQPGIVGLAVWAQYRIKPSNLTGFPMQRVCRPSKGSRSSPNKSAWICFPVRRVCCRKICSSTGPSASGFPCRPIRAVCCP